MRPLVLCYSLNGRTAAVARALAQRLDAEYAEIRCRRYEGPLGRLRVLIDIVFNRMPPVTMPETPMSASRQIIVGGPIWSGRPNGAMLTALDGRLRACYDLMIFLTYTKSDDREDIEHAFAEARHVFGSPFQAYTSVSSTELDSQTLNATAERLARLFRISKS